MSGRLVHQLEELVHDFGVSCACIPSSLRHDHPELEPACARLSLQMTLTPAGDEELIVVTAGASDATALHHVASALKSFEQTPYLILVSAAEHPERATLAAATLMVTSSQWLIRDDLSGPDSALLAPVARLLSLSEAPGEWRAGAPHDQEPRTEEEALEALWHTVDRDRAHLDAVARQLRLGVRDIEDARGTRDRLAAELARVREGERYELARMRLQALDERAWVAEQAGRIATSTSWRVGHRLVRLARALTLRRDRGTDLPAMIATKMEREELP